VRFKSIYFNIKFIFSIPSQTKCQMRRQPTFAMTQEALFLKCTQGIIISSSIGALLSLYSFYVEMSAEADENYEAMCDINEYVSCTKVFTSPYGRGMGLVAPFMGEDSIFNVPNGLLGFVFYAILGGLCKHD
jgi:uncharacterized membrane protein